MQDLINSKIKELTENGKLDEIVTKEATKFLQSIISDSLSSYGDVGKIYKEKMKSSLMEGFEKIDFIQFSQSLIDITQAELNKSIVEFGIDPAKQMIKEFVGGLEKKDWKLSEIIEKYKEKEIIPDDRMESGEIAFIYEVSNYGTIYISFDEEKGKKDKRYAMKYRLMFDSNGRMYSPTIDSKTLHPVTETGGLYGFDLFLFKLYAMGCSIKLDPDDVDTTWSTDQD